MDASFWHDKWAKQQIGFHQNEPNPLMVQYQSTLNLKNADRIFVPLCGKTNDISWLQNQGYRVCGIELNETAVQALFDNLERTPTIQNINSLKLYQHEELQIYVGDIFELTSDLLGTVQAVYDRAALVALPPTMRIRYTEHLIKITNSAQQLLITFDYDQNAMAGPPHAVPASEVLQHYNSLFNVQQLAETEVEGGFKKTIPTTEIIWRLKPR